MNDSNEYVLRDFERHLRVLDRSPRTIQSYREALEQLSAFRGGAELLDLEREDIEAYLIHVTDTHSTSTAANRHRSLRRFYRWAANDEELLEVSPMAKIRAPRPPDKPIPVISDEKLRELLRACDGKTFEHRRDAAIIRLFCEPGGPRLSEVAGMAVDDIDLTLDVVRVLGKGRRARAIPFGPKTGQALSRYLRLRAKHRLAESPALWLGGRGQPLTGSGITQMLRRRAKAAGIGHLHPHQLRHTAAHAWKAQGGDNTDMMRLFGWRSHEMAARYGASAADERARAAARRMNLGDRL